jgi:hypothetical protein
MAKVKIIGILFLREQGWLIKKKNFTAARSIQLDRPIPLLHKIQVGL